MSSYQPQNIMEEDMLDPEAFPFEDLWDTTNLFIEPFEIDDNFWEPKVMPEKKTFDMSDFWQRLIEIEMTYKAIRAILYNDDLCDFLKDMVGFDKNDFSNVSI